MGSDGVFERDALLELDSTYWTERWLLEIVSRIAGQRLKQIGEISVSLPDTQDNDQLKANMLEVQVEASLSSHDLVRLQTTIRHAISCGCLAPPRPLQCYFT